jgi:hypothetical protein
VSANTLKSIAVTAELTGTELSATALRVMDADLATYPEAAVLRALDRCRKELKGRLTLAAVLDRVEEEDGRPGADEAWAIALASLDEAETVVWTEEMAQAFEVARPVLEARDKVGARVAFRDAYQRLVRDAREAGSGCCWTVSLGHDEQRRAVSLQNAVTAGRLPSDAAMRYLPAVQTDSPVIAALIGGEPQALLECRDLTETERETNRKGLAALRAHMDDLERREAERVARYQADEREARDRFARRKADMLDQARELMRERGDDAATA